MFYIRLAALIIIMCVLCSATVLADNGAKTVRLLTVGNSFSGNAIRYLKDIASAGGDTLILQRADLPGCPMHRHWENIHKSETNPDEGKAYAMTVNGETKLFALKDLLTADKWDYITMQQASILSPNISTYRPYAKNLYDYFKKHAPQAEVMMHQTWSYRVDDPGFRGTSGNSHTKMYKNLTAAYRTIAKELGVRIMPVGDAMYAADTDPVWGYKSPTFNKMAIKSPTLPNQTHSLHVGWYWSKDKEGRDVLAMDGHHANALGCYLAGCVWYESMFGKSVIGNKFVPEGIIPEDVQYLQIVAHEAVEKENKRK